MAADRTLTRLVDALVPLVLEDVRIHILWIEGDRPQAVRRPYAELDLRAAVMDPDFDAVAGEVPALLGRAAPLASIESQPTDWDGRRYEVRLESGPAMRFTLERMSLIGKKGRAATVPVVDKTGQFRFVLHRTGQRS